MLTKLTPVIPFGQWTPDRPDYDSEGATVAKGCLPLGKEYGPLPSLSEISDALGSPCLGAGSFKDSSGNVFLFAGTSAALFRFLAGSWTEVSKSGGYSTGVEERWRFAQFNNYVIATNFSNEIQKFDMTMDTEFSDLSSTAPRARYLTVLNNFLVCFNTYDSDGAVSHRCRWSPLGDPTGDWTPDVATLAGYQDLEGGGAIAGGVGGQNYGTIILEREIWRMDFSGPPLIFSFNRMERERGSIIPGSIIGGGSFVYYWGENGIYAFDGQTSVPIGNERVDRTILNSLLADGAYRVESAVDMKRKLVVWSFPSGNAVSGKNDTLLFYSWGSNQFTYDDIETQAIFTAHTIPTLLDDLTDDSDTYDIDSDSVVFAGGRLYLGAISGDGKATLFNGSYRPCTIETAETRLNVTGRAKVVSVCPVTDASTVSVKIKHRSLQTDTLSETASSIPNTVTGEASFGVDDRFHRAEVTITDDDWSYARGVQIGYRVTGRR